ncbi:MAG: hypothetical protein GXP38_07610 [Chloroflexi bacterium]|nr:hypothetical protein [Chloroflexota bacterium]
MFVLMIILAALCAIALIVGFVWMLTSMGQTYKDSGPQVGAEMAAEHMADGPDQEETVMQTAVFKGKAVKVEREASISFRDIWRLVEARAWRKVIPALLAIGGMLGLFLFGSLALFLGMENKLLGGALVIMALYTVVRTLLSLARA